MADLNGLAIKGKIHYEIDSYVKGYERSHRPMPSVLHTTDKYSWDLEEEHAQADHHAQVQALNLSAAISPMLLAVLTTIERTVVQEHIWGGRTFHAISFEFPQKHKDGTPKLDGNGDPLYHDHKWVQRRWRSALKKMKAAAVDLPVQARLTTTLPIPTQKTVGTVAERLTGEQGEGTRDEVRDLVRQHLRQRRVSGSTSR